MVAVEVSGTGNPKVTLGLALPGCWRYSYPVLKRVHPGVLFGVVVPIVVAIGVGVMAYGFPDDPTDDLERVPVSTAPFEAQNELEDLLIQADDDPEKEEAFLELLVESTVFVVAQGDIDEAREDEARSMPFSNILFRGQGMLPVYTTRDRVPTMSGDDEGRVGTLPFSTILDHVAPTTPIVVNPSTTIPRAFSSAEVQALKARFLGLEPEMPELASPMPEIEPLEPLAPAALSERLPEPGSLDTPVPVREEVLKARDSLRRAGRTSPMTAMASAMTGMGEPEEP